MRSRACSLMLQSLLWKLVNMFTLLLQMWAAAMNIYVHMQHTNSEGEEDSYEGLCRKNPKQLTKSTEAILKQHT